MYETAKTVKTKQGVMKLHKFISQKDFMSYLRKEVKAKRNYKCDSYNCPLAEATGFVVGSDSYGLLVIDRDFVGPTKELPEWAKRFIDFFDNAIKFPGIPKEKTAERALFIMKNLDAIQESEFPTVQS